MAAYRSCEISKRLSDVSSSSSSESEDSDYEGVLSSSASQYSGGKDKLTAKKTTLQRLPTRKPDPNVSNRNALLARENRRKKKEYLETLEKELDVMKLANKKLHKTLKKHIKLVKKLQHEKQYYKGLLSSRTDILDLVSVLHDKVPPMGVYSPKPYSCSPTDSNRSCSSNFIDQQLTYELNDNGSDLLVDAPILSESFINDFNFFTDSDYSPNCGDEISWDKLLGINDGPLPEDECGDDLFKMSSSNSDLISGEHNYYQSPPDSGVCLHSVEGTIALENCITCEKRSCPLPDQLLVVG